MALAERSDDDLLIIELRLGRDFILEPGLIAFRQDDRLLLPLAAVADALAFGIAVRPDAGLADGWFVEQERLFHLDLSQDRVEVDGRTETLEDAMIERHLDDLYVDTATLSRWFPVEFSLDFAMLRVTVTTREALGLRPARSDRGAPGPVRGLSRRSGPHFPALDLPYRLATWPMLEGSLIVAGGSASTDARASLIAHGDLLAMSSEIFYDSQVEDLRWRLRRRHPDATLLGPLRARAFAFGDLISPTQELVSRTRRSRGFEISNTPLDRETGARRTSLEGDLLPGWRVELRRNDLMIDAQSASPDGRYQFSDIDLLLGHNLLRLTFIGPQGERREQVERILIGSEQVTPGKTYYRFGAYQQDEGLLGLTEPQLTSADEMALQGEVRVFAEVERGLTRRFSGALGLTSLPVAGGRRDYTSLAFQGALGKVFSQLYLIGGQPDGGFAGRLTLRTRIGRFDIRAEHTELDEFTSEDLDGREGLERQTEVRVNGRLRLRGRSLPFSVTAEREQFADLERSQIDLRVFAFTRRFNLTSTLSAGRIGDRTLTRASVLISGTWRDVSLFGDVSWDLADAGLNAVSLTAEKPLKRNLLPRLRLTHSLGTGFGTGTTAGPSRTSLVGSLTWEMKRLRLTGSLGYDSLGGVRYSLGVSTSLFRPGKRGWRLRSDRLASQGSVAARVFLDHNLDGRFDAGDEAIEGARLAVDGRLTGAATDDDGLTLLTGLRPFAHIDVGFEPRSFDDPFLVPTAAGWNIVPRPGVAIPIDFPVVGTGEVEGTVSLRKGGAQLEVSNVRVLLRDLEGATVRETRSSFDGFFLMDAVPPGRYTIVVDPDQIHRLGLRPLEATDVTIESGEIVRGVDLLLEQHDRAVDTTAPAVQAPAAPAPATPAPRRPQPVDERIFELQLGYFEQRPSAERFADRLRDRGLEPYLIAVPNTAGLPRYTVRVGPFPSMAMAEARADDLFASDGLETVIRYRRPNG